MVADTPVRTPCRRSTSAGVLGLKPVARTITLAEIFDRVDSGEIVEAFAYGAQRIGLEVAHRHAA